MTPTRQGSFRLFQVAGINVFLHWSWFVVAAYAISNRGQRYTSLAWNALEYLSLFLIVTMHEFGHALACRQVGGRANQIVLWPLGGVAYVDPPPRPGAVLWSIAAGPLVNVVLLPILTVLVTMSRSFGWAQAAPDAHALLRSIRFINFWLLIFNLLPIYPLDGGQILRSLLWFVLGRARSLTVASVIGFVGVAGLILLAVAAQSVWLGVLAAFILMNCWGGLQQARVLARVAESPRRDGFACPSCKAAPITGACWVCPRCRKSFDTFETQAVCPHCGTQFPVTKCLDCGSLHPMSEWTMPAAVPPQSAIDS